MAALLSPAISTPFIPSLFLPPATPNRSPQPCTIWCFITHPGTSTAMATGQNLPPLFLYLPSCTDGQLSEQQSSHPQGNFSHAPSYLVSVSLAGPGEPNPESGRSLGPGNSSGGPEELGLRGLLTGLSMKTEEQESLRKD